MPAVSVIIPNYNHAAYLEKRISSVLNQTCQDFEVIILDDKSPDNSRAVIERFSDHPKVTRVLFNEENGGSTFKQWNKGLQLAAGEYVWIAESDDYADPALLETLLRKARACPSAGIIYCESWVVDEKENILIKASDSAITSGADRWKTDFCNQGRDECAHYLVLQNTIPNASAVLFRKNVYQQAGPADASMRLAGDWLQWARMLFISDVAYVSEPLNYYRTHTATVRNASSIVVTEVLECHKVISAIAAAVAVPGQTRISAYDIVLDRWLYRMTSDPSKTIRDCYAGLLQITDQAPDLPGASTGRIGEQLLKIWVKQITGGKTSMAALAHTFSIARKTDPYMLRKLAKRMLHHYYPRIYTALRPAA